jgi:hypothetical protein
LAPHLAGVAPRPKQARCHLSTAWRGHLNALSVQFGLAPLWLGYPSPAKFKHAPTRDVAGPFDSPQLDGGYEISVKGKNCALDWESKQQCLNRVFQIAFFSECKEGGRGTLGEAGSSTVAGFSQCLRFIRPAVKSRTTSSNSSAPSVVLGNSASSSLPSEKIHRNFQLRRSSAVMMHKLSSIGLSAFTRAFYCRR